MATSASWSGSSISTITGSHRHVPPLSVQPHMLSDDVLFRIQIITLNTEKTNVLREGQTSSERGQRSSERGQTSSEKGHRSSERDRGLQRGTEDCRPPQRLVWLRSHLDPGASALSAALTRTGGTVSQGCRIIASDHSQRTSDKKDSLLNRLIWRVPRSWSALRTVNEIQDCGVSLFQGCAEL